MSINVLCQYFPFVEHLSMIAIVVFNFRSPKHPRPRKSKHPRPRKLRSSELCQDIVTNEKIPYSVSTLLTQFIKNSSFKGNRIVSRSDCWYNSSHLLHICVSNASPCDLSVFQYCFRKLASAMCDGLSDVQTPAQSKHTMQYGLGLLYITIRYKTHSICCMLSRLEL